MSARNVKNLKVARVMRQFCGAYRLGCDEEGLSAVIEPLSNAKTQRRTEALNRSCDFASLRSTGRGLASGSRKTHVHSTEALLRDDDLA